MHAIFKRQGFRDMGEVAPSRGVPKDQRGITLIEVLIGVAILGLIVPAFLGAIAVGTRATAINQERTIAESLGRTQVEALKGSAYIDYSVPGHNNYTTVNAPAGYSIDIIVVMIDPDTHEPLAEEDKGLQEITVDIYHQAKHILTIATYKAQL